MTPTLLIVEDDSALARLAARVAEETGFDVVVRHDGAAARSALEVDAPDALLTDLCLPGCDGLDLLKASKALDPQRPVLLMTGYATPMNAIEAFRLGVSDILLKPFDLDTARAALVRLKTAFDQKARLLQLTEQIARSQGAACLSVKSPAMQGALAISTQVAASPLPVLLEGETGVGKGVLARHIHALSPRANGPFFTLHCGALPQTLLESELFGFEKGAFSGATARKPGLLELAAGGTLFLDEINSTSLDAQTRLLQFIQDKQVFRIGGAKPVKVDVRLILATNESLKDAVREGRFREDLYYRIAVFPITVPPLRERREDLGDLAVFLLAKHAADMGRTAKPLTPEALGLLSAHTWPGNVRELENALQRALVLAQGACIAAADLPPELRDRSDRPACPWGENATLAEVEATWIGRVLARCDGNRTQAAKILGIDPSTLWRKLK
ncbi:MAG: response regulator [Thiobacillus sp.]|nr:response regulator [Thiobacillus sp.]